MEFDWFEIAVQVAGILAAVIGGFGAVPAVNWLKNFFGLQGNGALVLTVLFAVVWGVVEMFVGGQITQGSFTLTNLAALVTAVFAISQAKYKMLQGVTTPGRIVAVALVLLVVAVAFFVAWLWWQASGGVIV